MIQNKSVTKKQFSKCNQYIKDVAKEIVTIIDATDVVKRFTYDLKFPNRGKGEHLEFALFALYFPYQDTINGEYVDIIDYDYCAVAGRVRIYPDVIRKLLEINRRVDKGLADIVETNHFNAPNLNDFDKARLIHNYVCKKMHYCHEFDAKGNHKHIYAGFEDLVFGDCCVCNGYSRLYAELCDRVGIDCICVVNETHEWNKVTIDGTAYYVDCTWDDGNNIAETYCLKTKKEFYGLLNHPKATKKVSTCWKI